MSRHVRKDIKVDALRARLVEERVELIRAGEADEESRRPVELDQTRLGRLSRMDALQAQAMAIETDRRRGVEMNRIEAALKRLGEIGSVDRSPEYVAKAKDKKDPFRLMGFGHRVYKNYDPRARVMQQTCHDVLGELGIKDDPLLDVAMELEKIALSDEYFIEKKLYPNIDFYSGITLKAMGFPTTMFTALFALARTVGWVAQWMEMIEDPSQRIGRPRQLYTGYTQREYTPLSDR